MLLIVLKTPSMLPAFGSMTQLCTNCEVTARLLQDFPSNFSALTASNRTDSTPLQSWDH